MDDRQRRLQEIKRKRLERKKRRRKAVLTRLAIFMAVLGVIALVILSLTVFFPINNIVVRNPEPYSAQQVVNASQIIKGQNLWMAGNKANEKITAALPYISNVKIKRQLPGTIIITAQRAEVSYCYQTKNGFYLCDSNDKLLEIVTEAPKNVVIVVGCDIEKTSPGKTITVKNSENFKLLKQLENGLAENSVKVNEIDVTDTVNISFKAEDRFTVKLGSVSNISGKLSHLKEMIKNIDENLLGEINLSYWTVDSPSGIFTQKGSK